MNLNFLSKRWRNLHASSCALTSPTSFRFRTGANWSGVEVFNVGAINQSGFKSRFLACTEGRVIARVIEGREGRFRPILADRVEQNLPLCPTDGVTLGATGLS